MIRGNRKEGAKRKSEKKRGKRGTRKERAEKIATFRHLAVIQALMRPNLDPLFNSTPFDLGKIEVEELLKSQY